GLALVRAAEARQLGVALEVLPVPVGHRAVAQEQADPFEIREAHRRELGKRGGLAGAVHTPREPKHERLRRRAHFPSPGAGAHSRAWSAWRARSSPPRRPWPARARASRRRPAPTPRPP